MNITKPLFLLSLILFPIGEVIRIPLIKDVIVKPFDIAVGLTTLSYMFSSIRPRSYPKTSLAFPIVAFILISVFSLLINLHYLSFNQFLASVSYVIRWAAYAGIFFVVSSFDPQFKKRLILWLTFVGSIILLLGFIQYIFYPDLRNLYYLGWDEHLYRLFSTFLDPNFAGVFLVLFLLYLFSLYQLIKEVKEKIGVRILSMLTFVGILLTYSRSALVMLIVGSAIFLVLQKKFKIVLGLGVILVVFVLASIQFASSEGTNLLRTASSISRIDSAKDAIRIIKSNPILGSGFNAYRYALYKRSLQNPTSALEQHANSSPDTSILFVLATTGVVGLAAYLYLYFVILKNTLGIFKKGNILGLYVFSCMIGLMFNSIFINSLFYPFIMFWMWTTVGLTENT